MNESDIQALTAPITQANADMSDPRQHFAWALKSFPSPNPQMGNVPIPPPVQGPLSQLLWDFGFRHDPALQTKWLIPGDHPEGGYLNVSKLVDRTELEQYMAAHADPEAEAEQWHDTAQALLGKLNPKLAHRIEDMTPEQKAAAREAQRKQLPAAFERLAELAKQSDERQ